MDIISTFLLKNEIIILDMDLQKNKSSYVIRSEEIDRVEWWMYIKDNKENARIICGAVFCVCIHNQACITWTVKHKNPDEEINWIIQLFNLRRKIYEKRYVDSKGGCNVYDCGMSSEWMV